MVEFSYRRILDGQSYASKEVLHVGEIFLDTQKTANLIKYEMFLFTHIASDSVFLTVRQLLKLNDTKTRIKSTNTQGRF